MQITKPTFYKEFSCIAGACPDTCCAGWQIMIDEKSLQKYRRFKGPFRNRLHNDIDWKPREFFCPTKKKSHSSPEKSQHRKKLTMTSIIFFLPL